MKAGLSLLLAVSILGGWIPFDAEAQIEKLPADRLATLRGEMTSMGAVSAPVTTYIAAIPALYPDPSGRALAEANLVRVARDLREAKAAGQNGFVVYAVRAMSPLQRLPQVYPLDGRLGGDVRVALARDEYEAGSFQVFPFEDMVLKFEVNDLKANDGSVLPKDKLDLKMVKIWMQNGNAWYSYFTDTALVPVPELLLKDEALIKVDFENPGNYARVKRNGQDVYQWISPERNISYTSKTRGRYNTPTPVFYPMKEDFADADTLQPVAFKAGQFKQMWLTVRADETQKEGLYMGAIAVSRGGKKVADIPVAVRVLPFVLPKARSDDMKRDFLVCLYSGPSIRRFTEQNGEDRTLAERQLLTVYRNYKAHNLLNPMMEDSAEADFAENIRIRKEAGLPTDPIIGPSLPFVSDTNPDGSFSNRELVRAKANADRWVKFLSGLLGHTNIYLMSGDEPGGDWVRLMRPIHKIYQEAGLKFFTAGHEGIFNKGGYQYDLIPMAIQPQDSAKIKGIKTVDHSYVGFYAVQHNGSENPDFVRRQHGLLGYSSGFNMIINYEFGFFGWNDLEYDTYKPMMLAYTTRNGLVDTIEWEGFREAVDDIRYMTLLKGEIARCKASDSLDTRYAARQALMWLSQIDFNSVELDSLRSEIIARILKLRELR